MEGYIKYHLELNALRHAEGNRCAQYGCCVAVELSYPLSQHPFDCRDAMAESTEEMTPLKQKLDEFGAFLSKVRLSTFKPSPVMIDIVLPPGWHLG